MTGPARQVSVNAVILAWMTAQPHTRHTTHVDRFSLPTLDIGPLSTTGQGPTVAPGETILEIRLGNLPSTVPEEYFDYIPRDTLPGRVSETEGQRKLEKRDEVCS